MFSFDVSQIDDTYLRPCVCEDEQEFLQKQPKTFCYVEGTDLDISRSDTKEELGENVWFQEKPPKLFLKESTPLISARQIQISRIIMNGSRTTAATPEAEDPERSNSKKERVVSVSIKRKRSAVKFLSTNDIPDEQ